MSNNQNNMSIINQLQDKLTQEFGKTCKAITKKANPAKYSKSQLGSSPDFLHGYLSHTFAINNLEAPAVESFLKVICLISASTPQQFGKYRLSLLLFILEKHEHFILRSNKNLELYLKIIFNLKGLLAYAHEEMVEHLINVIKGINPYGIGDEKQKIANISSLILCIARCFNASHSHQFGKKFLMKHVKNVINDLKNEDEGNPVMGGISFWIHKLVQEKDSKDMVIDLVVSQPQFLLYFDLKNEVMLDTIIEELTEKRWHLDSLDFDSLMKIFKKYRNYFLKSEARVKLLDEKFKKQINKGYISKNSLNDYNEYFSNYVSELGSQNSSMIEKVVDSPNQPQKNQFRVDSSLPEFIKKKKTPTRLYPTTEKTNQSTSNLNPSRGISANPSFDSGKMELNGAINTHQQRPADLIDQTGKHKSSRCSDDITSYVGIGDYSEDKKQVLIKHPHPTFDISNPGSCYKIYTPNDNLGSVGYQKAEAKSRNSDGEVEDLKQSSTESDVPRFAKANNEGLPIVKIALSIRDKQKGQQSGAQEAPKAVDGDRIRELASRKVKEIMETVRRERSNSTMLEQSRTVDESDIGSQKGRSVYQNGVGGGLHKNELSTRRKLFMNSNPHSSIFKHQQSPASIEESTQKKKYDAKNASSQQVTHESILNAKNSFFSKNSLSGQRGAIEARFGTAEGRFTEVEAYKEDNKENTKYCQNRLISSKEGSARAKSNTGESNFESKHLLRSPHTPLTSTNLTLVRNLDVKEITPIVSPVNISRKQSLTGDIMTHNFNTLDTYSCATESKKETPYESTARLKVLKGTGGGLSGIKIPHNTAEISKHMDMDSEHSFKNRSGNSGNIPEPNTLGVSSTTNCPLEISKNSFSLERSTKFSHNHNNNSNQKYQNGMINGRQHGLGGPNMPSQGPGKAGFHQINTAKTSYMDPNKFYLSGEFLTPLKEMDNSKPSSMKKSNMIKNRDFTKKNFEDRANCNIAVLGNLNSSRMPLESPVINQGSPKKFHSIVMEEDEDLNYKTDDTKEFDFNTRFESEDWQETTRNHSNNPHQGHQPQIDLNHFKRKYGNYSSSGLSNSGYESGLSASINEQNMRSISFASNNHFEKKVMKEVLEGSLLKDPTRIAATSGHFLGETQMINFMREMYANFNHFLNFELKIAISHYVDRLSFKNKLISFFKTKEILNSDLQRGRILWRDTAEYWLDRFRANLLIDKVAPFGCRGKNSGNFSWMTRVEKSKYRTYFDMLNNRTRKVIISIKNLPMNVRKIRANFMRNSQIRQRLRRKEMPHELRPCLFFLNGQARHIHYYDLFLRKHSNVFSPSFEFQDSCIEDFKVDGIFGYVNSGKTVIVIRLDDFNVFDEFSVGERILSVFPLPGEEIAVVPKEGKEILIYRLRDPQRVARIVPISQGPEAFVGTIRLRPQNRLFVIGENFNVKVVDFHSPGSML